MILHASHCHTVSSIELSPVLGICFTHRSLDAGCDSRQLLPKTCKISIYTVDGSLVRKIVKDDESTELVWDMKNTARVPIASGTYLIHVDAGEIGETIIKWMGIMRELDLDSF